MLLQNPLYDTARVKILKLASYKIKGQMPNWDTLEISNQNLGKLEELHLEKGLDFTPFWTQKSSKDEASFYIRPLKIVGIKAKDQIRSWLKFGATLLLYNEVIYCKNWFIFHSQHLVSLT